MPADQEWETEECSLDEDWEAGHETGHKGGNSAGGNIPTAIDSLSPFALRREMELSLITLYDRQSINPRTQCFFLVSAPWLQKWKDYISGESNQAPGPMNNLSLYKGDSVTLRADISPIVDYRGVTPIVYFAYCSLYGTCGSNPICRYTVDVDTPAVAGDRYVENTRGARLKAEMEVRKMKTRLSDLGEDGGTKKAVRPERTEELWCWCIRRDLIGAFFECLFRCECCLRGTVRYQQLDKRGDEDADGDDDYDENGGEMLFNYESEGDDADNVNDSEEGGVELRRNFPKWEL